MNAPHNLFNTLQKFDLGGGRQGLFIACRRWKRPASGRFPNCPSPSASCSNPCSAIATAKRSANKACARWPTGSQPEPARRKFRLSSRASCCRTSPRAAAGGFGGDALRGSALGKNPKIIEPLVRWTWSWTTRCRWISRAARMHCGRIWTWNSNAIANVTSFLNGHAGVRHVQGRAARNRHRPSGQPGIPRQRRAVCSLNAQHSTLNHLLSRHAGWHGFAHDHDQCLGIVGWGVGGIEAEAGMLGQPVYFLTPDVVACISPAGCARRHATDLALTVTEMLRQAKVVGKFVEFFGPARRRCRSWTARPSRTWRPNTARRWVSFRLTPSA